MVPDDHLVRKIAAVLDLSWGHTELAPHYSPIGRPSIDPALMIRMLIIGYVFAIRSERALSREVQVNLAYRWFCGLSIENKLPAAAGRQATEMPQSNPPDIRAPCSISLPKRHDPGAKAPRFWCILLSVKMLLKSCRKHYAPVFTVTP